MTKEHGIQIENIELFQVRPDLMEFDLPVSPLSPPVEIERHDIAAYKRWLWSKIQPRQGVEWRELKKLAELNQQQEIVLLSHGDEPDFNCAVETAIRWIQRTYLLKAYEGLKAEEEELVK
jgi:hypothetical protein